MIISFCNNQCVLDPQYPQTCFMDDSSSWNTIIRSTTVEFLIFVPELHVKARMFALAAIFLPGPMIFRTHVTSRAGTR